MYIIIYKACTFLLDDKTKINRYDDYLYVNSLNLKEITPNNKYNPLDKRVKIIWYYDKSIKNHDSNEVINNYQPLFFDVIL